MPKICIMTLGSRGDVQPYVCLGHYLMKAGMQVSLVSSIDFKELATEYGVPFFPLQIDMQAMAKSQEGSAALKMDLASMKKLLATVVSQMQQSWDDCLHYAQGADILICHPKILVAPDISESLHIPLIFAHPVPIIAPIAEFPNLLLPNLHIGPLNRLSYSIFNALISLPFKKRINTWRKMALNLPARKENFPLKIHGKNIPILYAFSPSFFPQVHWPKHVHVTGAWSVTLSTHTLPPEVSNFLAAGSAPLCITFGSMPLANAKRFFEILEKTLDKLDKRAILISGWSEITAASNPRILNIKYCPHEPLLPHVSAVMHHGGIGTTTSTLLAGKPMIICPFTADQPFWARQMKKLGVCVASFSEKALSVRRLSQAISMLDKNPQYQNQAREISVKLKQENALAHACDMIKKILV